jgi:hypothetical protein
MHCVLLLQFIIFYELHVYSSMWSEAEALSEYGVVPELLFFFFYSSTYTMCAWWGCTATFCSTLARTSA